MKPLAIIGVLLILVGIAGLVVGRFTYTTEQKVLEVGPLVATADKEHSVRIPDIAGIVAVVAGGVLVVVSRRRGRA
jgi:xanthosine utilization system XapX-like protein